MNDHEIAQDLARRRLRALERDAAKWQLVTAPLDWELRDPEDARAERLRRTARAAVEDWLEAKARV